VFRITFKFLKIVTPKISSIFLAFLFAINIFLFVSNAQAAIPRIISYQSRLRDNAGTPIVAATTIQFSIYNHLTNGTSTDAASATGALLWKETYDGSPGCSQITPDADGYFSLQLGSCVAFPDYLTFEQSLYLGVVINTDAEASPRVLFGSHPYAQNSGRIGNFVDTGLNTLTGVSTGVADAGNQGYDSSSLVLQGSGWDGGSAQDVGITLQNSVTSADTYHFSILNNAAVEIFSANESGLLTIGNTVNYENLVINDDDIPNKKYVDDAIVSGTNNIYNFDGTLTEDRTVISNGNELTFTGSGGNTFSFQANDAPDSSFININPDEVETNVIDGTNRTGMIFNSGGVSLNHTNGTNSTNFFIGDNLQISDSINNRGVVYLSDYSANFTNRSLVDKEYVDSKVGSSVYDEDTDTGIETETTADEDWIRMFTSGSERFRIESNGHFRVGSGVGGSNALFEVGSGSEASTFAVSAEPGYVNIATFRDVDGENIFRAMGALSTDDLRVTFGDADEAYSGSSMVVNSRMANGHTDLTEMDLRFYEGPGNADNYVAFKAPTNLASDIVWTLPNADGVNGQVLGTNGTGLLSWVNTSGTTSLWDADGDTGIQIEETIDDDIFRIDTLGNEVFSINGSGDIHWMDGGYANGYFNIDNPANLAGSDPSMAGIAFDSANDRTWLMGGDIHVPQNLAIGTIHANARLDIGEGVITSPSGDTSILLSHDGGDTFLETRSTDMSEGIIMHGDNLTDSGIVRQLFGNGYTNGWEKGLHIFNEANDPILFSSGGNKMVEINNAAGYALEVVDASGNRIFAPGIEYNSSASGSEDQNIGLGDVDGADNGTWFGIDTGNEAFGFNNGDLYLGSRSASTASINFQELGINGQNYVGFKAPDSLTANHIWTLPNADGTNGQVLSTNGTGSLSWVSSSSSTVDNGIYNDAGTLKLGGDLVEQTYINHQGFDFVIREFAGETETLFAGDNFLINDTSNNRKIRFGIAGVDHAGITLEGVNRHNLYYRDDSVLIDSNVLSFEGLSYGADYSANFTNRSLVDKEYVDSHSALTLQDVADNSIATDGYVLYDTGASIIEDDGGAMKIEAQAGGFEVALAEAGGSNLYFKSDGGVGNPAEIKFRDARGAGDKTGIEYANDYSADFVDRSLVDKAYVDAQVGSGSSPWATDGIKIYPAVGGRDVELGAGETLTLGSVGTGQVAFSGVNEVVSGDDNFFWDDSNKRLGLGTTNPDYQLTVAGTGLGTNGSIELITHADAGAPSGLYFHRSRGTELAPTAITSGLPMGGVMTGGYDGSSDVAYSGGLQMEAAEDWSNSAHGTRLMFATTANNSTAMLTRMNLSDEGNLFIGGNDTASSVLHIDTNASNNEAIFTLENSAGDIQMFRADATPENSLTGSIGDLTIDSTSGKFYIKETGNGTTIGWKELTGSSGSSGWSGAGTGTMYATNTTDTVAVGTSSPTYSNRTIWAEGTGGYGGSLHLEGSSPRQEWYASGNTSGSRAFDFVAYSDALHLRMLDDGFSIANRDAMVLSLDEVVFNDGGDSIDFRVEGDNQADLLFVDAANDRVSIGTQENTLQIAGMGTGSATFSVAQQSSDIANYWGSYSANDTSPSRIALTKSRGLEGSELSVQNGDDFGEFVTLAYDGANHVLTGGIILKSDGTVSTNNVPSKMSFYTNVGAAGHSEQMVLDAGGHLGIGNLNPVTALHVDSNLGSSNPILTLENNNGFLQMFRTTYIPENNVTGSIGDLVVDGAKGEIFLKETGGSTTTGWARLRTMSDLPVEIEDSDADTGINLGNITDHDTISFDIGDDQGTAYNGILYIGGDNVGFIWNDMGASGLDFRIEGDNEENLFFADTSVDKIGIGTNTPTNGGLVVTDGVTIGTDSTNNLIDDATNGAGSTTLYIGQNTIDTTAPSDRRLKENIVSSSISLDDLMNIEVVDFNYKQSFTDQNNVLHHGVIAQQVEGVYPYAVSQRSDGYKMVDYRSFIPLLIESVQEQQEAIAPLATGINIDSMFNGKFMSVSSTGNVGIGIEDPEYKLHVAGGIGATGFINLSTQSSKHDIEYLQDSDYGEFLAKLEDTDVATYKYNNDCLNDENCEERLGLIAEFAPQEVLSKDGLGVDLYKMTSFLFGAIKAQQTEIQSLRIGALELQSNNSDQLLNIDKLVIDSNSRDQTILIRNHATFSADSVGQALIAKNNVWVRVEFEKEYEYQPIVTATLASDSDVTRFFVHEVDTKGFVIQMEPVQSDIDTLFNWHAFGVEYGKITVSTGAIKDIEIIRKTEEDPLELELPDILTDTVNAEDDSVVNEDNFEENTSEIDEINANEDSVEIEPSSEFESPSQTDSESILEMESTSEPENVTEPLPVDTLSLEETSEPAEEVSGQ